MQKPQEFGFGRMIRLAGLAAVVSLLFVWVAGSALASEVTVNSGSLMSDFGSLVASTSFTNANPGNFSAPVDESVYLCSGSCSDSTSGTYTYIFDVTNSSTSNDSLSFFNTQTVNPPEPNQNNFSSSLFYGEINLGVTGGTTTGGALNTNLNGTGFGFGSTSLLVSLAGSSYGGNGTPLPKNNQFTFFAQSALGPVAGTFDATDGGPGTPSTSLDPGPEPSTILLFGTGLLLLGGVIRKQLRAAA